MSRFHAVALSIMVLLIFNSTLFSAGTFSIKNLRINTHISPWVEEKKAFLFFGPKELFNLIDGAAPEYIDNGMKEGFFQRLRRRDSAIIEIYVEDFGTNENARKILAVKKMNYTGDSAVAAADTSLVITKEIIGGLWVCSITGRFYFELTLTGIHDPIKAKTEVNRFLQYYRSVINL